MLTDFHGTNDLTAKIIGCAYTVAGRLGHGFNEKVYENALVHELGKTRLGVRQQEPIQVHYDGILVGEYFADLVVEGQVLVEGKAVSSITNIHMGQVLNYLKAAPHLPVALIINFGPPSIQIRRLLGFFESVPSPCSSVKSVPKKDGRATRA